MDMLAEAAALAFQLHACQQRKGTRIPYVSHLLAVAALVLEDGGDETEASAALLHDAVEDQGGLATLRLIEQRFGARLASIVEDCSDSVTGPDEAKAPWQQRKERYLAHLAKLVQRGDAHATSVLRVSVADKLHNLRSILFDYRECGEPLWERFTGGREGTLWYYRALVAVYRAGAPSRWVAELERCLQELETAAGVGG